ncbi:DUF262 domain-containing protein [Budviciaceae bacterium CWB-B4]|uniref:DUF262 domain-containing protein n=1 Tax=Limnobaculum xujianqingii TaxID=2738837 RepID=A0A9D7AFZ3_9GAMM|nr:DUF262 domain-containing protein [Limnobaculum xujianqingii]MBK5072055.1 DUF262 domain-containing protein [Limnobaculum xujianqingii]MBK5175364.1 DUF262 domain-containing protein [Limnobaculum xujianqingii]
MILQQLEELTQEVGLGRKEIKTDSLSMSIGEIINLYKEDDIELSPAYQRLFRWDSEQKSRFIESIILGIPLPPIFVAQNEDGKWTVVDGLQRLSTILQLTGELIEDKVLTKPFTFTTTRKLPSLEGLTWDRLTDDIKRIIKRSKLNINIILTENSIQAQYELFQRLNTGGLHLEPQEIRNCLIIMLNESFYKKINELKEYKSFKRSLDIKGNKIYIEHHMELMLRYFIMKSKCVDFSKYKMSTTLLSDFIDQETISLLDNVSFNIDNEIETFKRTFDYIYSALNKSAFKKYNIDKSTFEGAFSTSVYEAIVPGVAVNIDEIEKLEKDDFCNRIKMMHQSPAYIALSARGVKALPRIKGMMEFSKEYFGNEN